MSSTAPESIDGISLDGFSEPVTVGSLRETRCSAVPENPGIYLILRASDCVPEFLQKSTGGAFKMRDPSCPPEFVREKWVQGARVVYVGKAAGRKGLQRRLDDLISFGYGKAVGHWGGRLLWHLPEREKLLVRWHTYPANEADSAESDAITYFKRVHGGKRPFANLAK